MHFIELFILTAYASGQKIDTRETILVMRYNNGIIVGTETRYSNSEFVNKKFSNRRSILHYPITNYRIKTSSRKHYNDLNKAGFILLKNDALNDDRSTCCILQDADDAKTQNIVDCLLVKLETRRALFRCNETVTSVAHFLQELVSRYSSISINFICAGYDHLKNCGIIYSIAQCGSSFEVKEGWATFGHGSSCISSILGAKFPKITGRIGDGSLLWGEKKAIQFVVKSISYAAYTDDISGRFVRINIIDSSGKREIMVRTKIKNNMKYSDEYTL